MSDEQGRGNNNKLDKNVQELGMCCTAAFLKLNSRPVDTIARTARIALVSPACIKNNRKLAREGKLLCMKRDKCMAAIWYLGMQKPASLDNAAERTKGPPVGKGQKRKRVVVPPEGT